MSFLLSAAYVLSGAECPYVHEETHEKIECRPGQTRIPNPEPELASCLEDLKLTSYCNQRIKTPTYEQQKPSMIIIIVIIKIIMIITVTSSTNE